MTGNTNFTYAVLDGLVAEMPVLKPKFFAARRKQFLKRLPAKSVAVIVTNPERNRSNDTDFSFRAASDFYYLSGFVEPESVLVLVKGKRKTRYIMFVRPRDKEMEIWNGKRAGTEGAVADFGADEAHTVEKFEEVLKPLIEAAENVFYRFGRNESMDAKFRSVWGTSQKRLESPEPIIHEMRHYKTDEEIAVMHYASMISAAGHIEAMRATRPGLFEYQVQARMEAVFKYGGGAYPAYPSIVGGGKNAVILHYGENNCILQDGDLLLIDAATEVCGYASDITRTFPVNGKFSPAQKAIYQLVLDVQKACIKEVRPGVTINEVHEIGQRIMREGLVGLGLLPAAHITEKGENKAVKSWEKRLGADADHAKTRPFTVLKDFYMHWVGHLIGMDVHDVGSKAMRTKVGKQPLRQLEAGMALTIEPGIYIAPDNMLVPEEFRGIGVRIEDDVVVTKEGRMVLTGDVPKEIVEIEALMALSKCGLTH